VFLCVPFELVPACSNANACRKTECAQCSASNAHEGSPPASPPLHAAASSVVVVVTLYLHFNAMMMVMLLSLFSAVPQALQVACSSSSLASHVLSPLHAAVPALYCCLRCWLCLHALHGAVSTQQALHRQSPFLFAFSLTCCCPCSLPCIHPL
jgi:hypothetical protein